MSFFEEAEDWDSAWDDSLPEADTSADWPNDDWPNDDWPNDDEPPSDALDNSWDGLLEDALEDEEVEPEPGDFNCQFPGEDDEDEF